MKYETKSIPFAPPKKRSNPAAMIIARQDRIPIWALPYLFIGVIGLGFLFTFFDIFDINVSFIQTCVQIVPGCSPQTAVNYLGLPVLLNLIGYVIGTLALSPLADRYGRRDMLVVTMVITGIGSLFTALVTNYPTFIAARLITGIGIGADLAIVNTYINELAPSRGRARYTSLIFIMSSLGAFFGIWVGLFLTTPATPFPFGLPFAIAGPNFVIGWRVMYMIGAVLAVVGILLRFELPETPRWLISRGKVAEAERVVEAMEAKASSRVSKLPPISPELPVQVSTAKIPYAEIFSNSLYLKRTILLLVIWLVSYITVYSIAAGLTTLLAGLQYPPPEAGLIAAIGTFGFILAALFAFAFGESLERKYWLPISAVLTLAGGVVIALGGNTISISLLGAILLFFGFNLWVPITYTWSTENYPTRARATGFALVDGVGHVGGGIGLIFIASLVSKLGPLDTFILIGAFLMVAACLAQFGIRTKERRLDDVSP